MSKQQPFSPTMASSGLDCMGGFYMGKQRPPKTAAKGGKKLDSKKGYVMWRIFCNVLKNVNLLCILAHCLPRGHRKDFFYWHEIL